MNDPLPARSKAETATAELRTAGYEPLEPYPGRVDRPWRVRCADCGAERAPTMHDIRKGRRCKHSGTPLAVTRTDPAEEVQRMAENAAAELRAAGFEPLEPYPGTADSPWRARCLKCGAERRPRLLNLRKGRRCGHKRWTTDQPDDATAELRAAGLEPLEPYPGTVRAPWRAVCIVCGAERMTKLNHIRNGRRCKHKGTPFAESGGGSRGGSRD